LKRVPWSFRFELRLIWHGGMRIVRMIEHQDYDTLSRRPSLTGAAKAAVLLHALASR